jgi:hypothetical protein
MYGARNLGYLYQLLAVAGWSSLPWLWSLPQPTLVLMGRDDPLVPPINGHILAALIPNAELRMIDDGHLFIVTRPAETAGLIEAFLTDVSRQDEPSSPLSRVASWVRGFITTFAGLPKRSKRGKNNDAGRPDHLAQGENRWPLSRQKRWENRFMCHLPSKATSTG